MENGDQVNALPSRRDSLSAERLPGPDYVDVAPFDPDPGTSGLRHPYPSAQAPPPYINVRSSSFFNAPLDPEP
jgi:hypothetical protein